MLSDRQVTLSNWLEPPFNRTAFQHMRELVPTASIRNTGGHVNRLSYALQPLDDVVFTVADGSTKRWGDHLIDTFCDAVVVVHGGEIVFERYFDGMTDDTPHLLMSVSKSFCGAVLGISIGRGLVEPDALVCDVAPEFAGTSVDGATVQHLIDMTAGTDFVEDYDLYDDPDGDSPLIEYERHAGYRPLGDRQPTGTLGQFATFGTAFEHGSRFDYRSPLTNVAARVVEIVNAERYPDVVSRYLWDALGQEHDADIMLDPLGHPVVEGGMSCSARDLARLGFAYLNDGKSDDRQVIPSAWVTDTHSGSDEAVVAFAARTTDLDIENWSMYRNAFWVIERGRVYTGIGIYGQYCWIDRSTGTVIARFSSFPEASPDALSEESLAGFSAVSDHLGRQSA